MSFHAGLETCLNQLLCVKERGTHQVSPLPLIRGQSVPDFRVGGEGPGPQEGRECPADRQGAGRTNKLMRKQNVVRLSMLRLKELLAAPSLCFPSPLPESSSFHVQFTGKGAAE